MIGDVVQPGIRVRRAQLGGRTPTVAPVADDVHTAIELPSQMRRLLPAGVPA